MRPLSALSEDEAQRLEGVVFDLDDTLLDGGALTEAAYSALFRLRESGLALIACTGRPAPWGEMVARQWPVDAAIAENGALFALRSDDRVSVIDPCEPNERRARRETIREVAAHLFQRHPELHAADDNEARVSDFTIDIGEYQKVARPIVEEARREAQAMGVGVFVSSVHMHLTLDKTDKASGSVAFLVSRGADATRALSRYAYVGDSENDAPAFAAFHLTFGVANVRAHAGRLSVPPKLVATRSRGMGFAEISGRLVDLRSRARP